MTDRRRRPARHRLPATLVLAALATGIAPAATIAAAAPTAYAGDATVAEPTERTGTVAVEVPVTLAPSAAGSVSVNWRTVAGTAGTADFLGSSGVLTIPAGAHGGAIVVHVRADRVTEGTESFAVELTGAAGATLGDAHGTVTITSSTSGLSLGDAAFTEPDGGSLTIGVSATLAAAARKDVTFGWQLRSVTGTVGSDAPAASGTAVIPRGSLGTVVRLSVSGDTAVEPDETLEVVVTSIAGASLADGIGSITLRNTDVPPPPPPDPFGWTPPAGAVPPTGTALYVESPAGEYIGQGGTYLYTKANSLLEVSSVGSRVHVSVEGDEWWTGDFAQPSGSVVATGYWENLRRYPFFVPGLSFSGEGRGCNTLLGRLSVDQVTYDGSALSTLTLRFEQRCEGTGAPLRGFLRYDAGDPTTPPPPGDPAAFAWQPPAGTVPAAGNYLYFESSPGDRIGQGQTRLHTEADSTFTPDWGGRIVQLFVNAPGGWSAEFSGPDAMPLLTRGLYENVQRFPFHNPAKGGMDFSGEGRGCNEVLGTFAVDEITWDGTELASVSIRFVQRCEVTGPPLYGALRWQRPAAP
ncbi:MAG TPA: Calx-beta domain-containing protein [Candidatus Limnocylindrales bacterium]|nr:Calx-beta domain-containing protein [Candidatus Limnocylindrales bacterium]